MIRIGGFEYRVEGVEAVGTEDGIECNASFEHEHRRIRIVNDLSPCVHDESMLHEIGHAFINQAPGIEIENVEGFCEAFSNFLTTLIRQNGLLKDGWSISLRDE